MRDDDNRRNKYYFQEISPFGLRDTQRLEVANCAKLKPSIFRSGGWGILAATQLREISSPRLANAQVDSFKDDNSVAFHQTRARTHIRVETPRLTKRLPQNLTPGTLCGRSILVTLLPHDAATDPKLQKRN